MLNSSRRDDRCGRRASPFPSGVTRWLRRLSVLAAVTSLAATVTLVGLAAPAALAAPATTVHYAAGAAATAYSGRAFDTCTAPPLSTVIAWSASPYRALGIYIGGVNRTCGQAELTASWVGAVSRRQREELLAVGQGADPPRRRKGSAPPARFTPRRTPARSPGQVISPARLRSANRVAAGSSTDRSTCCLAARHSGNERTVARSP